MMQHLGTVGTYALLNESELFMYRYSDSFVYDD